MRTANLVIRPEKLGDLIVAIPTMRAFKETFPSEELHVLTDSRFQEVLQGEHYIDKIIAIDWKAKDRDKRDSFIHILKKLNSSSYSYRRAAILYSNCSLWNWLAAFLRIRSVSQIGGTRSAFFLGHKIIRRKGYETTKKHFRDFYLDVAASLGAHTINSVPEISVAETEVRDLLARFPTYRTASKKIILHLGASPEGENYGADAMLALAPTLAKACEATVYLTGTHVEKMRVTLPRNDLVKDDFLGNVTLREMMVLLSQSDLCIMNSTGTIHLAAALGCKVIGLYGCQPGNDVHAWGPISPNAKVLSPTPAEFSVAKSKLEMGRVPLEDLISADKIVSLAAELI